MLRRPSRPLPQIKNALGPLLEGCRPSTVWTGGSGRQAARLVDKIINGANPAEIPVEVNRDVEFVINLTTARLLGLKLASEVTYRANRFVH